MDWDAFSNTTGRASKTAILVKLLNANAKAILPKFFGITQQYFSGRRWDTFCAVSSHTVIDRDAMPNEISDKIFKSEFLIPNLIKTMGLKSSLARTFSFDSRPAFSDDDLASIISFLTSMISVNPGDCKKTSEVSKANGKTETNKIACKKCGSNVGLSASHGRYGYFVKCNECDTNTSMKSPCVKCNSKNTKVSKAGDLYTLICNDCSFKELTFP